MNADIFNMSIRKFLKRVGVSSQHEIEQAVAKACSQGSLKGNEKLPVKMQLTIAKVKLDISFEDLLELS